MTVRFLKQMLVTGLDYGNDGGTPEAMIAVLENYVGKMLKSDALSDGSTP